MSNTTVNQAAKDFLSNLIYNVDAIRNQVENRMSGGNSNTKTESLPKAA